MAELKAGGPLGETEREKTAVLGGLQGLDSKEEAETWLKDKLTVLKGPEYTETYCKGDEFKGILFAKFATKKERDSAVSKLTQARRQKGAQDVWANPDLP